MEKKGICVAHIKAIENMHNGVLLKVTTPWGATKDFSIMIGQHKGSPLNPYLFNMVVDVLSETIKEEVPMCIL